MPYENSGGYEVKRESEIFSRKAPRNMFRVIGEDIRSNNAWLYGDVYTKEEAIDHANKNHGDFVRMHVYDDTGQKITESNFFASRFIH